MIKEIATDRLPLNTFEKELIITINSYILHLVDSKQQNAQEVLAFLKQAFQLKDKDMISIADTWVKKGEQRDIQRGMQQGLFKTAKNLLKKGVGLDFIKEVTGLTPEQLKALQ